MSLNDLKKYSAPITSYTLDILNNSKYCPNSMNLIGGAIDDELANKNFKLINKILYPGYSREESSSVIIPDIFLKFA